jgi:hypothetical protein
MWEAIESCKGEYEKWHKCNCLFGDYPSCGVHKLSLCLEGIIGSHFNVIQWDLFALETTMAKNGQPLKKLTLVYKSTTSYEFIQYLQPKLQPFVKHNFVARWEDKHFKQCIKSFPTNTVVFVVEFAKKYSFKVENEGATYALAYLPSFHFGAY